VKGDPLQFILVSRRDNRKIMDFRIREYGREAVEVG
jgi:hypothetical protein